jgi:hypothetical protein
MTCSRFVDTAKRNLNRQLLSGKIPAQKNAELIKERASIWSRVAQSVANPSDTILLKIEYIVLINVTWIAVAHSGLALHQWRQE